MPNTPRCQWRLLEARCSRGVKGTLQFGKRVCDRHRESLFAVSDSTTVWVGGEVSSEHLKWVMKTIKGVQRATGYCPTSINFRKADGGVCWAKYHLTVPSKGITGRMILLHEIAHGLQWGDDHGEDFYAALFKLGKRWLSKDEHAAMVEDELMYKPKGAKGAAKRLGIKIQEEDVTLPRT